jgi:hypothetical protein
VVVRRACVNLILIGFIAGSVYDIVRDEEHWPFSQYPMFAVAWKAPTFTWLRVFGVDTAGREFPLDRNAFIQPFDQSRLPKAFRQIAQRPDGRRELQVGLSDVLARYDTLRREGVHNGPPVAAMRLYEMEWTIDRAAANVNHPDRRTLLAEVRP